MKTPNTHLLPLLALFATIAFAARPHLTHAQNPGTKLTLKTGVLELPENVQQYDLLPVNSNEELEGRRYMLVQFYQLPNARQRQKLAQQGLKLLDYQRENTYLAALNTELTASQLQNMGLRSVLPVPAFAKWDPRLDELSASGKALIEVMLLTQKDLTEQQIRQYLTQDGIQLIRQQHRLARIQLPADQLPQLLQLPYVCWIEPVPERGEPEDTKGRSLLRANAIDGLLPSSYQFDGTGVSVLVRDDGAIGPHIDYQGRLHNAPNFSNGGTHGDGVGGIMAGAGNLDPYMRGMAAGADVYAIPYQADFLDNTLDLHIDEGILVTNSSYSNGCNDGYTSITHEVDQQMYDYPTFLHVFSAGNSNNSNCGYGAGNQWGNITGGHKQGKNVIATANLYQDGSLVNSSSRGPAHDGRIKPDIAANGAGHFSTNPDNTYQEFGGTSGAAPCIAGITAQLHQAYQTWNGGDIAPAALLKNILLNTATDLGNTGPDFKFGWGQVNALRALRALEENRYTQGSLDQGENTEINLNIPAGLTQVKIMLYWADIPAQPNASIALINDLDLTVESPDGTIYYPYVLDHTPDPNLLDMPATTGEDHLNNVEQVALETPEAGNWTIRLNGTAVPMGPQQFYLSWDFIDSYPELTYPNGGEGFSPGDLERIHWDAYGNTGDFVLEYSIDSGQVWNPLATLNGNMRMYDWTVPDNISGKAFIRISRNGQSDTSEVFSIISVPQNLQVTTACPDSIYLSWDEVAQAAAYDLFMLGEKYMDSIATTTTNSIAIPTPNNDPSAGYWFAVRAVTESGMPGQRSIAIFFDHGLLNCPLDYDLGLLSVQAPTTTLATGCNNFSSNVSIELRNNGQNPITQLTLSYQINNQNLVEETPTDFSLEPGQSINYTFNTPIELTDNGNYQLAIWGTTPNDEAFFNDTLLFDFSLAIYPGDGEAPGYTEDFEAGTLPDYWQILNPDQGIGWSMRDDVIGSDGNTTYCYYINNYAYSDAGQEDALITLPFDLSQVAPDEHVALSFDLAYAYYNETYIDALRIDIYTDCGNTFAGTLYYKEGSELQTDPPTTSLYAPSDASSWRKEFINLDDYKGESVILHIVNITGYGNSLFIDNISLITGLPPTAGFEASSPSVCQGQGLLFLSTATGEDLNYSWNFGPGSTPGTASGSGPYVVIFSQVGSQIINQTVSNGFGTDTYQQVITVMPPANAAFSYSYQGDGKYQFTSNSVNADTYLWDFGDGNTSTEANPLHQYQTAGDYTVSLSIDGPCGSDNTTENLEVITSTTTVETLSFALYPNPNSGSFFLHVAINEPWGWSISDLHGHLLLSIPVGLSANKALINTKLLPGIYILRLHTQSGQTATRRISIF